MKRSFFFGFVLLVVSAMGFTAPAHAAQCNPFNGGLRCDDGSTWSNQPQAQSAPVVQYVAPPSYYYCKPVLLGGCVYGYWAVPPIYGYGYGPGIGIGIGFGGGYHGGGRRGR